MKEEELVQKLKSIHLPSAEMEDHRRRLRAALLIFGRHAGKRRTTTGKSLASRLLARPSLAVRVMKSPQPAWKVLVMTIVTLALVSVGTIIGVKILESESPSAMAADIACGSPEVQEAIGASDFKVVDIEVHPTPTVTFEDSAGDRVVATVDLENRKVTSVTVLSPSEMQRTIDIAMTNTAAQELVAHGACFTDVMPVFSQNVVVTRDASGNTVVNGNVIEGRVMAILERGEERWAVEVDIAAGSVVGDLIALS